jgi:hypothetical protein
MSDGPKKMYFRTSDAGTWIECDYNPDTGEYTNCHEVPVSRVPRSQGGEGPEPEH